MSTNMQLWQSVCMTDPKAVKQITGKSYQGNSPKPYWLIQRATEVFGPVGIGWGVTVKSERFERLSETDVLHVAVVSVWYVHDGKRSETFDQMGGTKAAYKTADKEYNGKVTPGKIIVDEDAGKKSVTDALVKCLSMIGFAGDIFSGRWDDSKYVAEAAAYYNSTPEERAEREAWEKRCRELETFALDLIDAWSEGKETTVIQGWYNPQCWSENAADKAEEQKYVWGLLKNESRMRSTIKAHHPDRMKEPA